MSTHRAVLYARVSTWMQERDGVSLDAQLEMAQKFCHARGMDLVGSYTDVESGSSDRRPELAKLEQDLEAKRFDAVLVYKVDRLSRDPAHYHQLLRSFERQGVGLASLTQDIDATTTMGRFILNIMIAVAEMEASQTADRVRDSIRYRAGTGRMLIGKEVPIGYRYFKAHTNEAGERVGGRLEVEPTEAAIVRWIFERFVDVRSVRQVVQEAAGHGFTWRTGRPLNRQGVTRILRSPLYKGEYAALKTRTVRAGGKKQVVKLPRDQWLRGEKCMPELVPEALWDQAQAILDENAKTPARLVDSQRRHPWSGLLRCATCGGHMTRGTAPSGRQRQRTLHRYVCGARNAYGREGCAEPAAVSENYLERFLLPDILAAVAPIVSEKRARHQPAAARAVTPPKDTARELAALTARMEKLQFAFENSPMSPETFKTRVAAIEAERSALLAITEGPRPAPPPPRFAEDLAELWRRLELVPGGRNQMLRSLVDVVEVSKGRVRVVFTETSHPEWPEQMERAIVDLRTSPARSREN